MSAVFSIMLLGSEGGRRVWRFGAGEVVLGSDAGCDVVLYEKHVSAKHVQLHLGEECLRAEDMGSVNGTLIDGQLISGPVVAKYPVSLRIGEAVLAVQLERRLASVAPEEFSALGGFSEEDALSEKASRVLGRAEVRSTYTLKREMARGALSRVYEGEDSQLNRPVAVKVSFAGGSGDEQGLGGKEQGFFWEAAVLARLPHPNIVPVYSCGEDVEGRPAYGMKLVKGKTLQEILDGLWEGDVFLRKHYSRDRLLQVFTKICDAMAFAHSKGILHRDLKPDNVMVGEFGEVLVMDWGLAKALEELPEAEGESGGRESGGQREVLRDPGATMEGDIVGTPRYMSPEQAEGRTAALDERSDVYALGGMLYAILTYRPPVEGRTLEEVIQRVREGKVNPMNRSQGGTGRHVVPEEGASSSSSMSLRVPEALEAVVLKAMALDRAKRYRSVSELQGEVEAFLGGFAPEAQGAGLGRQVWLLVQRHRLVSGLVALFVGVCGLGVVKLAASRQQLAATVEQLEVQRQMAQERAREAIAKGEELRVAMANSHVQLAESAAQRFDSHGVELALQRVPEDLRARMQGWHYMQQRLNSSERVLEEKEGGRYVAVLPLPAKPSRFLAVQESGRVLEVNVQTGERENLFHLGASGAPELVALSETVGVLAVCRPKTADKTAGWLIEMRRLRGGALLYAKEIPGRLARMEFSTEGEILLTQSRPREASTDRVRVTVWETASGKPRWEKEVAWNAFALLSPRSGDVHFFETEALPGGPFRFLLRKADSRTGQSAEAIEIPARAFPVVPNWKPTYAGLAGTDSIVVAKNGRHCVLDLQTGDNRVQQGYAGEAACGIAVVGGEELSFVSLSRCTETAGVMQFWNRDQGSVVKSGFFAADERWPGWMLAAHPVSGEAVMVERAKMRVWSCRAPKPQHEIWGRSGDMIMGHSFLKGTTSLVRLMRNPYTGDRGLEVFGERPEVRQPEPLARVEVPAFARRLLAGGDGKTFGVLQNGLLEAYAWGEGKWDQIAKWETPKLMPGPFLMDPSVSRVWLGASTHELATGKMLASFDAPEMKHLGHEARRAVWGDAGWIAEIGLLPRASGDPEQVPKPTLSLVLWDANTGKMSRSVEATEARSLDVSPDRTQLLEAGGDRRIRFRDVQTLEVLPGGEWLVHDAPVSCALFHPKLPLVVTGSEDLTVKIWNRYTGVLCEEIGVFRRVPGEMAISEDGSTLSVQTRGATPIYLFEPESFRKKSPR